MNEQQQLYRTFSDEAAELVSEIEDGLLRLEKNPAEKGLLDAVFRAAHTIKGSSASIGLTNISSFTHDVEEILDLLRKEKLPVDKELISALLAAADRIREMVSGILSDGNAEPLADEALVKRFDNLKNRFTTRQFKIIFVPDRSLLTCGIDPVKMLASLADIGEIVSIKAYTDDIPTLSEIDLDELYLRWDLLIKTDMKLEEISKIFESAGSGSQLKILPAMENEKEAPPLGQMLVDEGTAKGEDIAEALRSQKRIGDILIEQNKATPEDIKKIVCKQNIRKIEQFTNSVSSTIRVDLEKLDQLINRVGEMVIMHSMLQQTIYGNGQDSSMYEKLDPIFSQLQRIGRDIQESTMSLRMLPLGEVFKRFTRLVRELSSSKNKKVELIVTGGETELDKGVIEKITDPLVHIIRNAIDHGIETSAERTAAGKPEIGTIHLSSYHMSDSVCIEVEDDGAGLDKGKILERAITKGIIQNASGLTDPQIHSLIFLPGFSTAKEITNVSGRGVGMDVVRKNIEALNGKITIHTKPGKGTTISIRLPLTLAIIEGLTASVGDETFVIPATSVIESFRPKEGDVTTISKTREVVKIRGEFVPLIRLYEKMSIRPSKTDPCEAIVVFVSNENCRYCLLVDKLIGQQQIVIKNLGAATPKVREITNGTILGDGRVALVLDLPGIFENAGVS
jgi:two-component system chemotaxis sensor kinase CheA